MRNLILCLLVSLNVHSQNLIVNPGAEGGAPNANGWTVVSAGPTVCSAAPTNTNTFNSWFMVPDGTTNYPAAHGGTHTFFSGCSAATPAGPFELYQDIDLTAQAAIIDASHLATSFTGFIQTPVPTQGDGGRFIIDFLTAANAVLGTSYSNIAQTFLNSGAGWLFYSSTRTAPAGTRKVRIRLQATITQGPAVNVNFDDLSFTVLNTLPVTLISFEGNVQNSSTVLTWLTSQENNVHEFIIERCTDGIAWLPVGTVTAQGRINGSRYQFTDPSPAAINLYRLKMIDINQGFRYSNVISMLQQPGTPEDFVLYPNPAKDILHIRSGYAQALQVSIINSKGQIVSIFSVAAQNNSTISVAHLNSGVYVLQLKNKEGITVNRSFMKMP